MSISERLENINPKLNKRKINIGIKLFRSLAFFLHHLLVFMRMNAFETFFFIMRCSPWDAQNTPEEEEKKLRAKQKIQQIIRL